jgi:hypothetical protein
MYVLALFVFVESKGCPSDGVGRRGFGYFQTCYVPTPPLCEVLPASRIVLSGMREVDVRYCLACTAVEI